MNDIQTNRTKAGNGMNMGSRTATGLCHNLLLASGFTLVTALTLAGCGADGPEASLPAESPVALGLSLRLVFPDALTVDVTRAAPANPTKNGIELTDIRVLQFPGTGAAVTDVKNQQYRSGGTADPWYEEKNSLIEVKTGSTDFNNEDSNFYIIANSGDALTSTDSGALKTTGIGFSDITTEPGILVYGPKPYTKTTGSTKPVEFLAKLCRAYAYVTVNYTPAKGITITSAAIENVPDKIYPIPDAAHQATTYLAATPTIDLSVTPSGSFSFYLPENLKGSGTATTEPDKNRPAKGPGGSLGGCTCVVLRGTYNYYPDTAGSEPIDVEYRFYLGSDMIRNYDVERGRHYTLTVNLQGANSSDARVSVTNGNVFAFDDPDNVNNGMDFN